MLKPMTVWTTKNWKILKETGIPDHLTCPLRKLHVGQEATIRSRRGAMDWFKTEKGVQQGFILSPSLFNFYAEYIIWNARLYDSQAGIKIAGRNINNVRYEDDTILIAESEEELKILWRWWKSTEKRLAWNSTFKKLRSWHPVPSLHGKKKRKKWKLTGFIFLGSKITVNSAWLQPRNWKMLAPRKKSYDKPRQHLKK